MTTDELDRIVTRKAEWIVRRMGRAQSHGPPLSQREFVSGESILYLGRHYRLRERAVMIRPANERIEVWLCVEPVGFRKQSTGLATLVQDTLAMDPFAEHGPQPSPRTHGSRRALVREGAPSTG